MSYIDGTFDVAKVLKVKLNINNLADEEKDISYFVLLVELLCSNALNTVLSYTLKRALINKVGSFEEILGSKLCSIKKEVNLNNEGYSIKFTIKALSH